MQIKKIHLTNVDSTQNYAKRFVESHIITNPYIITADMQTSGYGKNKSKWHSIDGNLFVSYILPLTLPLSYKHAQNNVYQITASIALAVSETLDSYGIKTYIKWYNDILIKNNIYSDCRQTYKYKMDNFMPSLPYSPTSYEYRRDSNKQHFRNKKYFYRSDYDMSDLYTRTYGKFFYKSKKSISKLYKQSCRFMKYKKIAGILVDRVSNNNKSVLIVGIGVNINGSPNMQHVTCIKSIYPNIDMNTDILLSLILKNIYNNLSSIWDDVYIRYKNRLAYINHAVRFYNDNTVLRCKFLSIDSHNKPIVSMNNKLRVLSYDYRICY